MISKAKTPEAYLAELPPERKEVMEKLRRVVLNNLPEGFEETMNYGMIGYVVPHSIYQDGYHCSPELPLPFLNLASQKNHIGFYHMGIYSDPELLEWFTTEFPKHSKRKLDMGKSCIRFKNPNDIPYELLGELVSKISVADWIRTYENTVKR
ncbi:DUF1801 domain-containing protein [Lentiprolixibacter aurantiacus]|uniref:DUF1801 domain-containing protein n=1 Tax=Lentiprolixibacter aurantiacus TaxID=2993939 RepID=A0AAE3MJI1_9FLAO|nr:DUF1801 domain-containing protein [Lentiprolixibacter aurantiacus]MCX2718850.1 DUF1801 domain-containing protein [Lentiprolixibacter aurantiacus]